MLLNLVEPEEIRVVQRGVTIAGDKVVGFGVALRGLSDADSMCMQSELGGAKSTLSC